MLIFELCELETKYFLNKKKAKAFIIESFDI